VSPPASAVRDTALLATARRQVLDEGRGLSETERIRAFDRFWQAGEGRDGFGLGLAIVRRLMTADGGDVQLRAGSRGGLEAVVRLHRAEQHG